jgi:hypothetical protein
MDASPNSELSPEVSPADLHLHSFNERALARMFRTLLVVSILAVLPAFWRYGWIGAIGFAAGAAVSCLNFRALEGSVSALADRIVNQNSREKGGRIVLRFLLRYGLVATAAYAIFLGSTLAFRGFLWGLCLPVVAMMIEAGCETYAAFRHRGSGS